MTELFERQIEVLKLVAIGKSYKMAAAELGITEGGVQKHIRNIMDRVRIDTVIGLTHYALAKGYVANMCSPSPAPDKATGEQNDVSKPST